MAKYLLGGALAAAMVAIVPAVAQAPAAPVAAPAPMVQRIHVAKTHTRADVGTHVRKMFERFDSNRDGFITKAETAAAKAKRGERKVMRMNKRGAGGQHANRGAMFDRLDTNRDGAISRPEFEAAPRRQERRIVIRTDGPAGAHPEGAHVMRRMRMGGGMGMGGFGGHMFDMADVNKDGRVSMQEASDAAYRHFDMADANRDGQITREERMQMRQKMRAERRPG